MDEQTAETTARMTAAQRAEHWQREAEKYRAAWLAVIAGVEAAESMIHSDQVA